MTPLEKRCRRVVGLLPRTERDARGEEVLGVLLDLSAGRTRPPLVEVAAVAGLSMKLRLRARVNRLSIAAPVVVATLAMVVSPWPVGAVIRLFPSATTPPARLAEFVGVIVMWLAGGSVWLLGLRRTAAGLWLTFATATVVETAGGGYPEATWYLFTITLPVLITAAALVGAVRRGVPSPRPVWAWLLLMLGTAVLWAVTLVLTPATQTPATIAVGCVLAILAGLSAITGPGRGGAVAATAVVVALTLMGWAPAWVGVAVISVAVGVMITRRRDPDYTPAPSTSLVT